MRETGEESRVSRRSVVRAGAATVSALALGGALTGTATAKAEKKIKVGQSRVMRLGPDNPSQSYVLELKDATNVTITLRVGTKRGDGDGNANGQDRGDTTASLELLESSGTSEIETIDTGTGKTEAQIIVSPLSVGTHRIEASTDSSNSTPYTLTITGSLCC